VEGTTVSSRQKADLPEVLIHVTEYRQQVKKCPCCGAMNRGEYPGDVKLDMQYGARVKAFTAMLRNSLSVPYAVISNFEPTEISNIKSTVLG
jgi:transposase